ncbi:hypothetical protein GAYE_SCF26G4611 [Galdieria yellowstonensis]|uniref:RelA/SpoT domain-containing protein n=1 Tax=Galdieria yellowstonensis TaxID=3028027 RepID=A0AAV9IGW8_9RHOD|nr:hypothetical protein GAYE_SCF26G4611 [Galdieria yellowstonensis]
MDCVSSNVLFLCSPGYNVVSSGSRKNAWLGSTKYSRGFNSSRPGRFLHCTTRACSNRVSIDASRSLYCRSSRRSRAIEDHFEKLVASFSAQVAQQICPETGDKVSCASTCTESEKAFSDGYFFSRVGVSGRKSGILLEQTLKEEGMSLSRVLPCQDAVVVFPLAPSSSNSTIYSFRTRETWEREEHSFPLPGNLKKERKKDVSNHWSYLQPFLSYLSTEDLCKVELALKLSSEWVSNLVGREATSLITKIVEMTVILASYRVDKDCIIANFLSALEEKVKYATLAKLALLFDGSVSNILREYIFMGKMAHMILEMPQGNSSWVKSHLWASISEPRAVLLRLVERLWTLRHVSKWPLYLQQSTALEILHVFVPLANAAGLGSRMYELGDLSLRILFPQSYLKFEKWHLFIRDQAQDVLSSAQRELLLCLMRDPFLVRLAEQFTITGRTKDMVSTFIKMLKQNKTKEQILDFIAMRVIIRLRPGVRVERVDDIELAVCSRVYEIVTSIWKEVEGRYKDYVIAPKPNGYRSIHTTVRHPSGFPIEVQIRTEEMHLLAEYGSASHRFYKGEIEYKQPNHPVFEKAGGSGV